MLAVWAKYGGGSQGKLPTFSRLKLDHMNFLLRVFLKLGRIGRIAGGVFWVSANYQQGAPIGRKNQRPQIHSLISGVLRQLLRLISGGFGIKYIALPLVVEHPGQGLAICRCSHVGRKCGRQVVP